METENKEKKQINYPKKPKRDTQIEQKDSKTKVICNLRQITLDSTHHQIKQYAIHFEPEIAEDNFPLKKKILRQVKPELHKKFQRFIQGGDTLFVCGENLPEKIVLESSVENTLYRAQFVMTKNTIDCRNIRSRTKDHIKIKNLIEILVKNIIYSNNHIVKFDDSSFYDYFDVETFGRDGKGKIWHGYSTAVCITENGLFLRINDKNKMITGKTAHDKMIEIGKKYRGNMLDDNCQREIKEYFKGRTVVAQYGNYRAYRIGEVLTDKNLQNTSINYVDSDGKTTTISLKNYYQNQYKINIKNEEQPLFIDEDSVKVDESKRRYLVPELVYLTGIDELEEKDRADIIAKSKFQPGVKVKKIEKGMSYLTQTNKKRIKKKSKELELPSPDEVRKEWGINFGDRFVEVEARCLNLPELEFGESRPEKPQVSHGRFRQKKDIAGINFDSQNCCLITFNNIVGLAKNDCDQFCKACNAFGISFKFPELIKLNSHNDNDLLYELKQMKLDERKKILIVVLDRNTKNLYPLIKDYLYSERGITSQFMLHDENPNRGGKKKQNMSYYSAVLNQMVVKAQGELFRLHFCKGIDSGPSMIIGLDSSKTKDGNKYVLSASYNRRFNKFFTDFAEAKSSPDDHTLCNLFKNALNHFRKINNILPNTIIIYRQGGNDKQTEKIMKNELPKILEFLDGNANDNNLAFEKGYKPKITMFTVNKKTDLKFFENTSNGYKNIAMGTVIDQDVISPDLFEFYLQCPDVDRGTASPVHFLCIYNDNEDLSINDFEDISYKQSFYYWNWPGPVRIPAALKYAEVANAFSSRNLTHEVKHELKDSPYYI